MQTRLSAQKRLLFLCFLIVGIILGIIFVSPKVNGDKSIGGGVGFISSILLSYLIFPEMRENARGIWNENNTSGINMKTSFTHPTQIPLMLGLLWFCLSFVVMYLFDLKVVTDTEGKLFAGLVLLPFLLLFGFSGFVILRRNEYVDPFGKVINGFWARFNGVLAILFGWGGCIALLVGMIFDL